MTIAGAAYITAADQLQIHNASGYLRLATAASLAVTTTVLAAPTQNYNLVTCTTPATVTSILTTNVADGFVLVLRLGTITDTVTFTDTAVPTAGQLALAGSFSMNGADASLTLICVTQGGVTYWVELARSEASSGITMGKAIAAAIVFG